MLSCGVGDKLRKVLLIQYVIDNIHTLMPYRSFTFGLYYELKLTPWIVYEVLPYIG